jgi:copper transport protein
MRTRKFLSVLALMTCASVAHAHAHLKSSIPADASTSSTAPHEVVLTLSEAAKLTTASIQKQGGAEQALTSLPAKAAVEVHVPLPALEPGAYVMSWRALSDDGHIMPGQIHFTIAAKAATPPAAR